MLNQALSVKNNDDIYSILWISFFSFGRCRFRIAQTIELSICRMREPACF